MGQSQAPEWVLVHGVANGPPGTGTIGHAWLEHGAVVYDPVLDRSFPVIEYQHQFGAMGHARYTAEEAAYLLVQHGHYGPW
jgi:hypothetical protein